jgi:methyl-accepting chemotaxis protein
VGKHHRIFCDGAYANSAEYREFWEKLRKGEFQNGEYMRINKEGKPVWIRATYNPILNLDGEPFKVVKYAQDITDFKVSLNALSNFLQALRQGNFDAQIDLQNIRLSGDLAVMIDNNLALRDNLKQIILEIKRVVELAGQEGQLTERLKMGNVAGAWKELVDSINDLLHSISNPVLTINEAITSLSMGDLTNKVNLQSKGDIQNMANALNIAVRNLNRLLKDIQKSSTTVGASSDEMTLKFAEMEKNTGHVVAAIEQISQGMREQVARTDESSKLVEGILKSTGEMGQKAEVITKSAEAGMESCQSGMSIMKKLVENMQEISNSAASTSTTIEVLTGRSEEISRTLNVITDIAAQTNLLALNAAIEAARAGDAGRGFAVVAEEIRKLAEDSRKSAVGIDKVIKDVQKDVNLATRAIQQMETNVRNGNSATHEAEKLFENILDSSKGTFRLSQDVLYASGQQKEAIGTIVKNIEKIVVVSEQTARNTDGVVKAANMLNTSVGEVLGTSKALNTISSQLKDDLSKFKLSQD